MTLHREEIDAILHEASLLPERRSACIEALKLVQARRGWISDASLADIAALLGMSTAELDNVATFYNLIFRRPVGRHVILACDSVSCFIEGAEAVSRALCTELGCEPGGTTADGRFTLLPIACLGQCERAPALMIDDDVHPNVAAADVPKLLEDYE